MKALGQMRRSYRLRALRRADLDSDPIIQFGRWLEEAARDDAGEYEANAMALATCGPDGEPSVRMVLLKAFDSAGFVFYTSYKSAKGRDLAVRPVASVLFHWAQLERQVRITGRVARVTAAEADGYFASRPRGSQLAAQASPQSSVLKARDALEARVREVRERFRRRHVPRPAGWGGYRIAPYRVEFWQGRQDRLHDRLRYDWQADGSWLIERLAP